MHMHPAVIPEVVILAFPLLALWMRPSYWSAFATALLAFALFYAAFGLGALARGQEDYAAGDLIVRYMTDVNAFFVFVGGYAAAVFVVTLLSKLLRSASAA